MSKHLFLFGPLDGWLVEVGEKTTCYSHSPGRNLSSKFNDWPGEKSATVKYFNYHKRELSFEPSEKFIVFAPLEVTGTEILRRLIEAYPNL